MPEPTVHMLEPTTVQLAAEHVTAKRQWTTEETVQSPTTWAWGQWEHWASSGHGAKISDARPRGPILAGYGVSTIKTIENC